MIFNKKAKEQADLIIAYQRLFDSEDGAKVLADIARMGWVDRPTFAAGDPHETSFREGQRYLALSIIQKINTDPAYVQNLLAAGQSKE